MKYFLYLFVVLILALLVGWYAASQSGQVELAKAQAEQTKYLSQVQLAQTQADLERSKLEYQLDRERTQAEIEQTRSELEQTRLELQAEVDQARLQVWQSYIPIFILILLTVMVLVAGVVAGAVVLAYREDRRRQAIPQVTQLVIPGVLSEPTRSGYVLASPTRHALLDAPRRQEVHSERLR